jgi:predicted transcriptional regulator
MENDKEVPKVPKKKGPKVGTKLKYEHTIMVDDLDEYDVHVSHKNHLKQGKIYNDFCMLNQEFLKYILSLKFSKVEYDILFFLLSYMDHQNKIIIDAEMISYNIGVNQTNVNKYIAKLVKNKVIYKRNLGYKKGVEVLLNFDIISPHMTFKAKNNKENVDLHKQIMRLKEVPYIRKPNMFQNSIDYINPETGEVFHTSPHK